MVTIIVNIVTRDTTIIIMVKYELREFQTIIQLLQLEKLRRIQETNIEKHNEISNAIHNINIQPSAVITRILFYVKYETLTKLIF